MCVKAWQKNPFVGISFLVKLHAGTQKLYLNDTPTQVLSHEFYWVSLNIYLQNICERLFLLFFLKFHILVCEELQDNEDQLFSDYVNVNHFEKNTTKFHAMWRNLLHEATSPGHLFSKIWCFTAIVFTAFSA